MAENPRFQLKGELYDVGSVEDVGMRDLLLLEIQTEALGKRIDSVEFARLAEAAQNREKSKEPAPDDFWILALTVWASKVKRLRDTGDRVTQVPFEEAIDFSITEVKWLEAPKDRVPKKRTQPGSRAAASKDAAAGEPAES